MAGLFQKLLTMGGKQVAKRSSTEAAKELAEEAPEVIGKGTSKLAKEASEEIPEAAWREITPEPAKISSWDALIQSAKENPKTAALLTSLAGGTAINSMMGDKEPPQIPFKPEEPIKADEPKTPEQLISEVKKQSKETVKTEAPKPEGLAPDAQAKEAEVTAEEDINFRKILEQGIASRDKSMLDADLLRASERISAGLSRTKAEHGSSDIKRKEAEKHIEDAKSKIMTEKEQVSFDKAKSELNDEKAMRDPNSEISKLVSDLAVKTGLVKPGQSISAMSLKNAGVNLGNLLATMEAGKARKETAAMMKELKLEAKKDKLSEQDRKFVQGLRKEATTGVLGKQYATYSTGQRMASSLEDFAANPSGYKDYATLMGGLKSLQGDESVVREAEVRLGMSATSAIDAAYNHLQKLATGKMLTDKQRKEMISTINTLTDASRQQYMQSVKPILEQAEMEGIDPELILSGSLSGAKQAPANNSGKTVVKKQYSASRNQTKLIFSDGSEEIVDGKQ